jgi:hypothetical protein
MRIGKIDKNLVSSLEKVSISDEKTELFLLKHPRQTRTIWIGGGLPRPIESTTSARAR